MIVIFTGVLSLLPTKAFTLVCRPIHKHFGGDDITERQEHLHQLAIPKLLREVVDEQVATLRPCSRKKERTREREKEKERETDGNERAGRAEKTSKQKLDSGSS